MVYSEINLHVVWQTKLKTPLIKAEIETALFDFLRGKISENVEIILHALGGTENHVHVAVSIPPTLNIAAWLEELKTASAGFINQTANRKALDWQTGFGVIGFGTKDIKWVKNYVENQKELHEKGKTFERLERIKSD